MNIAIISLTRFGDLLQIQPVITALSRQGQQVDLLCLNNFSEAAGLLQHLEHLHPLPGAKLLAKLDQHWPSALHELISYATVGPKADMVLNLTPTLSGRLLARLCALNASEGRQAEMTGFCLDDLGFGFSSNPWATFLLAAVNNRGCSPFNLVDLFMRTAGLSPAPEAGLGLPSPDLQAKKAACILLKDQSPADMAGWLALQLGASAEQRRWPVQSFASVAQKAWRELKLCPVLLGSPEEEELGREFMRHSAVPVINMIGKTNLKQLSAVLSNMSALISNDTGTMHLAAGLNLPLIAIFLATAQAWDTGPYLPGTICLEPDIACHPCSFGTSCPHSAACRTSISPSTVFDMLKHVLTGEEKEPLRASGARVWKTVAGKDGFMDLLSLSGHETADRTAWVRYQKFFFRHFLDAEKISTAQAKTLPPLSVPAYEEINANLIRAEQLLTLLAAQGEKLAYSADKRLKEKFLLTWGKLNEIWRQSDYFNNLSFIWLSFSQDTGDNLSGILALINRFSSLITNWRNSLLHE